MLLSESAVSNLVGFGIHDSPNSRLEISIVMRIAGKRPLRPYRSRPFFNGREVVVGVRKFRHEIQADNKPLPVWAKYHGVLQVWLNGCRDSMRLFYAYRLHDVYL